jgi:hypothetical protein
MTQNGTQIQHTQIIVKLKNAKQWQKSRNDAKWDTKPAHSNNRQIKKYRTNFKFQTKKHLAMKHATDEENTNCYG